MQPFGGGKSSAEKAYERSLKKASRETDRERSNLERQEKKLMADIKKEAKAGQHDKAKIMAKDLVRMRARSGGGAHSDSLKESDSDHRADVADPHNLVRFMEKQRKDHAEALGQLQNGRKTGCWSWWIFPTAPFIKNGCRLGSPQNMIYEIANDEERLAYLSFESYPLRANYIEVVRTCVDQLSDGTAPRILLRIDVPRFEASVKYFGHLAALAGDKELEDCCTAALKLVQKPLPASREQNEPAACAGRDAQDGGSSGSSSLERRRASSPRGSSSEQVAAAAAAADGDGSSPEADLEERLRKLMRT